MVIVFFNFQGLVCTHYVEQGQKVNGEYYCTVLDAVRDHIRRKWPSVAPNGRFLQHDNVHPHMSALTKKFLARRGIWVVQHYPTHLI